MKHHNVLLIVLQDGQALHIETEMTVEQRNRLVEISTHPHEPVGVDVECRHLSVSFKTKFDDLVILHQ